MRLLLLAAVLVALSVPALAAPMSAGAYQAVLGDCEGCHGKNLAGGVALMTPFGKLVTTRKPASEVTRQRIFAGR